MGWPPPHPRTSLSVLTLQSCAGAELSRGVGSLDFVFVCLFNLMICKVMVLFLFLYFSAHT